MRWIGLLLICTSLSAAPIGNPSAPSVLQQGLLIPDTAWCQPRISFTEDYLFNKRLSSDSFQKWCIECNSQLGAATWSMWERFDLSVVLGTASSRLKFSDIDFKPSGGLVWYGEGRLILIELKDTSFCLFGEAGGWDWMNGSYSVNTMSTGVQADLMMRFWEAGAAFTQKIGFFTPYIGVAVSQSKWKISRAQTTLFRLSEAYSTGPFLGFSLAIASKIAINLEWRGVFENSLAASSEIRF